jgi:hypothetical protein
MSYEIIGIVGDVNPLQYGGWLIGARDTQIDCLAIEPIDWESGARQGEGIDCYIYRVALDRMKVIGDIATKTDVMVCYHWRNEWTGAIVERVEWWDTAEFRKNFTEATSLPWSDFQDSICSENPVKRAYAWVEIAQYFGIQNLDDSPTRETEAELKKRFALPFYRARKFKKVTVYA